MFGGDGFWMFEDPSDPAYIYAEAQGGEIGRVNRYTHDTRPIQPLPEYGEKKLHFNWNTPIHMSPNEKGTIYIGARSEERRVGKECRSRWSRYHEKKKERARDRC